MIRSRTASVASVIIAGLFGLTACTNVHLIDREATVGAKQLPDLPVPAGFALQDARHESHTLVIGGYRFGHLRYTGNEPADEVASYLMLRVPQHSWMLESDREGAGGGRELVFRRDEYSVTYRVGRAEPYTSLTIDLRTTATAPSDEG